MINTKYDPAMTYRYVMYGRMSSSSQNERSPDQQFNTIQETIQRLGYPWQCVGSYRDDAMSGRFIAKRKGLQDMLGAIESEQIVVDLIIVDTKERFGRNRDDDHLRSILAKNHGVLLVTADSQFASPVGIEGELRGMMDQFRSTEHTRILSHNVKRGKKDAVRQGHWPGSKPPFGYRLKRIDAGQNGNKEPYNVLEPDPRESLVLRRAFERAAETGEGCQRLAQWWNEDPEISEDFKPTFASTMTSRLKNPIAIGTLLWGVKCCDIVNDTRITEKNPDGPEVFPNFCPPIVSQEIFDEVQRMYDVRSVDYRAKRQAKSKEEGPRKLIEPLAPGLALKYPLTGLVRCGLCNGSMRAVPSGRKSKANKSYLYYSCPRYLDGACENSRHVLEDQLRKAVIDRFRLKLFTSPETEGAIPDWLPGLMGSIEKILRESRADDPNRIAAIEEEVRELNRNLDGWMRTLGKADLPDLLRKDIEEKYDQARHRRNELTRRIESEQSLERQAERILDPKQLIERLRHLDEILARFNPTLCNLELSRHLDRIACFPDGRVEMRGTYLGLFEGAVELLSRDPGIAAEKSEAEMAQPGFPAVVQRRRTPLRVPNLTSKSKDLSASPASALDPRRFAGLDDSLLWDECWVIERGVSWAERHGTEVVNLRAQGLSMEKLAQHFGKTPPTLRNALKFGRNALPDAILPQKAPRARWHEDQANEVMKLWKQGRSRKELAAHFKMSDPTIRKALKFAEAGSVEKERDEVEGGQDA